MADSRPILAYWDIRGLAAPLRLILRYAGVGYEDRTMIMSKPEWLNMKHSLGFDFPNLPYYEEGDLRLTQSQAILRHLARKFRLEGESERERCMADMLVDQLSDFRASLVTLCYTPSFSQDLLQQWVSASGSYSSAQSLEKRIDTFERFY